MQTNDTPFVDVELVKKISWGSVFAGVIFAVIIQIALSLLGLGIGFGSIDVQNDVHPLGGLGIGTVIWYFLTSIISLYTGGWIAGRLSKSGNVFGSIVHGLLTWAVVTLLTLYFLTTTLGSLLGGVGKLAGGALQIVGSVAGKGLESAAPVIGNELKDLDLGSLKRQTEEVLKETGKDELQPKALQKTVTGALTQAKDSASKAAEDPMSSGDIAGNVIDQFFAKGKNITDAVDKEALVNVIRKRTGKSKAQADTIAQNWIDTYTQAVAKWNDAKSEVTQKAKEMADAAASAASKAAIISFFALLAGAFTAAFASTKGLRRELALDQRERPKEPIIS